MLDAKSPDCQLSAQLVMQLRQLSLVDLQRVERMMRTLLDLDHPPSLEGTSVLRVSQSIAQQALPQQTLGHPAGQSTEVRALPSLS